MQHVSDVKNGANTCWSSKKRRFPKMADGVIQGTNIQGTANDSSNDGGDVLMLDEEEDGNSSGGDSDQCSMHSTGSSQEEEETGSCCSSSGGVALPTAEADLTKSHDTTKEACEQCRSSYPSSKKEDCWKLHPHLAPRWAQEILMLAAETAFR